MTTGKPPAAKLPLAIRKNVRDEWETKKPELEKYISEALKTSWTIDVNPLAIIPYAKEGDYGYNSLGACIHEYFYDGSRNIKKYVETTGVEGSAELNSVAYTHTITLIADPTGKFTYCGGDIVDGVLRILFHPDCLGSNINDAIYRLQDIVSSAPQPANASKIPFTARHSIKEEYEARLGELQEQTAKQLPDMKVEYDPNFEEIATILTKSKKDDHDWERNFGDFVFRYFSSVTSQMRSEKFESDDMLREGFEEAVSSGVVKMRVVDKLVKETYNELILEDGVMYLQTTPEYWGSNIDNIALKLVDVL